MSSMTYKDKKRKTDHHVTKNAVLFATHVVIS